MGTKLEQTIHLLRQQVKRWKARANPQGHNLVEDLESVAEITYTFNKARMIVEPFMLFLSFFAFFVVATVISRMSTFGSTSKPVRVKRVTSKHYKL